MKKIIVTSAGPYYGQYAKVGQIVDVEGLTIKGHPYIISNHENNAGHKVVFQVGYNCEVVE